MFLLEWTTSDLVMMASAVIAIISTVLWLVPGASVPRTTVFDAAEIIAYDRYVPRYFLAAAIALIVGGAHTVIKSLPGFWQWLWEAGYGGHLFRDLSNSHIIIVGGGTVLLTGITWYVLPRLTNRPLYSTVLAGASFWFTVIGVFGFYLAWLILGLVEGQMVRQGWTYMDAKAAVGAWHRVPTRITSGIMGVGYWTYVLNVLLTAWGARHIRDKPQNYLTTFLVVSALALFVGTVQGVIQVLPANADWIHAAGKFGEFVDPVSHAHINLVTGMVVSLAAFLIFFSRRMGGTALGKHSARWLFWTLVPGSLAFYLAFLIIGLVLGGMVVGSGGLQWPSVAPVLSRLWVPFVSMSGSFMLLGFWIYFVVAWRSLHITLLWQHIREASPAAFWLVSTLALLVGTLQGLLQALPTPALVLTIPEEIPNIHAQLNMIGGVLLALIGLVYLLLPELTGQAVERRLARVSLAGIAGGIGCYYLATVGIGMLRLGYLRQGLDDAQAAAQLGWAAPAMLTVSAVPMLIGYVAFGSAVFRATRTYRAAWLQDVYRIPAQFTGPLPSQLRRLHGGYICGIELVGGLFGWPGLGWLYAGQALPGIVFLLSGPVIAWALLPALFSPFAETSLSQRGWVILLMYLPLSALVSTFLLALYLRWGRGDGNVPLAVDKRNGRRPAIQQPAAPSLQAVRRTQIPQVTRFGVILGTLALISIPIVPLIIGVPEGPPRYTLMSTLPDQASGAYLHVRTDKQEGFIKLYTWNFPLDHFPIEAPALNPAHVRSLLVSQKGLDAPQRYQLFRLEDGQAIALQGEIVAPQRQLRLMSEASLLAGKYLLDIPKGGMFAGREYYYFGIDPTIPELPIIAVAAARRQIGVSSDRWLIVFPACAALVSGAAALVLVQRLRTKVRPYEAAWAVAFTMFASAAGSQVVADLWGWTPFLTRLYYVSGATLVVGWLGLGSWLLLVRQPALRQVGIMVMMLLTGYAWGMISLAPVETARLATDGWHALVKPIEVTIVTIALNCVGTLVLVGGALWSAWIFWRKRIMRARMLGCLLLAGGALTVAAGGSLTRLGHAQYLYIAMSVGVSLMFWGYLKTIQPTPADNSSPRESQTNERVPQAIVSA